MPKTFNGLQIPPLPKDLTEIQATYCDETTECADHCDNCIYDAKNINPFTVWFNKKRYYGK